jgi:hypothetical protein
VQEVDKEILDLIQTLRRSQEALAREVGVVGNVITLFFHDLVIHFSGILIHRRALRDYDDGIYAPWVNKGYALTPFLYPDSAFRIRNVRSSRLVALVSGSAILPMSIGESIPYGYQQSRGSAMAMRILGRHEVQGAAYLPKKTSQLDWATQTINEVCQRQGIRKADIVSRNLQKYFDRHTCSYLPTLDTKGILIGTRCNLQNRKHALNFLQQQKTVVGLTHGEISNSVFDEPVFGYSDRTLCTNSVDYGTFEKNNANSQVIIQPKKILRRTSKVIEKLYRPSKNIAPPSRESSILYIPTMHQGNFLWGPYHAFENCVYDAWQNALIKSIPRLTIKVHPKTRVQRTYECPTEERQLEECLYEFDVFVFDFFATGAALAIFSDRPVLYFDIGLRRFNGEFEKDLGDRCFRSVIDMADDKEAQIRDAIGNFEKETQSRRNTHLKKYALCEESGTTFIQLARTLIN